MPKSTVTVTALPSPPPQSRLGPYLIYYFQFAESSEPKAERYLAIPHTTEHPAAITFAVDTHATHWLLEPLPDAHNRFFIYQAHNHHGHEHHFKVLNAVKVENKYVLAVDSVKLKNAESATVWTVEQGDRRNKIRVSTLFYDENPAPIYWATTAKPSGGYEILVRDLGTNYREGEFVLEELELLG